MSVKRKTWITIGAVTAVALMLATSVSYEYRPTVFNPYYPVSNRYYSPPNVTLSGALSNWSVPIGDSGNHGMAYITIQGFLVPSLQHSNNLSLALIRGTVIMSASVSISIANETPGNFFSSLTFFVTNFSLSSDNSTLVFPLSSFNYYPNGATTYNNQVITPSSGIEIVSYEPVYNLMLLRGWVSFWFNFTIVPAVVYGPYYSVGSPIPISMEWRNFFSGPAN